MPKKTPPSRDDTVIVRGKKRIIPKRGEALDATATKNCLSCVLWTSCSDGRKAHSFLCSRFTKYSSNINIDDLVENQLPQEREDEIIRKVSMSEVDIEEYINKMLDSNQPMPADIRVDDGDLPRAKNFFEFTTGKQFLNITPYPKQLEIGILLFAEYCPRCSHEKFRVNRKIPKSVSYSEILEKVTLLEHERCPKCKVKKVELVNSGELYEYREGAICAGQRGGKSAISAINASYSFHQFLKLNNPTATFGLLPNAVLHATFTALTEGQARKNLWGYVMGYIHTAPWFKELHKMLNHYGNRYSEELYRIPTGDSFIHWKWKNLYCYVCGPDINKLRGDTRFYGSIDELGLFDTENADLKRINAQEVYTSMRNAFTTLRQKHDLLRKRGYNFLPVPMLFNIGSPKSRFDKIYTLTDKNKNSKKIFTRHWATWEMHPTITKEWLREDVGVTSELAFMRDYGAVPPMSSAPFIPEIKNLKSIVRRERATAQNAFKIVPKIVRTSSGRLLKSGRVQFNWQDTRVPKVLALDAGEAYNSFAFAVGHIEENTPIIDGMGEVIPTDEYRLSHTDIMEHILLPIVEKMNVQLVTADRWQNIKMVQDIEQEFGIEAAQYSPKYSDFESFRQDVWSSSIRVPRPEVSPKELMAIGDNLDGYPMKFEGKPVSHFIFQCLTVQDFAGKSVEKGTGLTDDVFRATILAYSYLIDGDYQDLLSGKLQLRRASSTMAVIVRRSEVSGAQAGGKMGAIGSMAVSSTPSSQLTRILVRTPTK